MTRLSFLRFGLGTLTLASLLRPGPAAAGYPDDVSLIVKDDKPMQAWVVSEAEPHDAVLSTRPRPGVTERTVKAPYPPIVEHPRTERPTPGSVWVSGFWRWDAPRGDFVWVPGRWVTAPPNSFWVDGSWRRDGQGWYRVPGFWSARKVSQTGAGAGAGTSANVSASTSETAGGFSSVAPAAPEGAGDGALPPPAAEAEALPTPEVPAAGLPDPAPAPATAPAGVASPQIVVSPQASAPAAVSVATAPAPTVYTAPAPSPVVALADQLAGQAAAFEQVFGRTARVTPGGGSFLAEARQIRGAALGLRQVAAAGDAYGMSQSSRQITYAWQRMAARVNQIAPGRTGPNIQQIWLMGSTAAQIGRSVP